MEPTDSESSENPSHYSTITAPVTTELKIKNSRFLAVALPVENQEACLSILKKFQKRYHDASHICFAYRIGTGDKQLFRVSDAGEPAGSAGAPILKVLEGANLTNIIVLVVRYFGGTKLGIGGLIRAYTAAAKQTLNTAKIIAKEITETLHFKVVYDYLNPILHEISVAEAKIIRQDYSEHIEFTVSVPIKKVPKFKESLLNISAGKIEFISKIDIPFS